MEVVLASVLVALKESLRLQGSRGLHLKRATSGDTPLYQVPELKLNICMVSELFVQILATGLGVFAVIWATAILLGGFSNDIPRQDFWVITGIVFIQTARFVGLNASPEAEFFNQVPPAFLVLVSERYITGNISRYILKLIYSFDGCLLIMMGLLSILVLAVQLVAGAVCISLSIYRLVVLSRHNDNFFVFKALVVLYALMLLQGGLFIIWLWLRMYRFRLAYLLSLQYKLEDKRELIDKYMDKTLSTAIKNGLSSTISRNLASFAAADLKKSDYSQDHIDAVLVIHTLTSQEDHRPRALSQIQSSPLCASRLLDMVTSKGRTDHGTKICIAEILAHLASNLRLADISGATESISSMIDSYFRKRPTPATDANTDPQIAIEIPIDQQGAIQSTSTSNGGRNIAFPIKQLLGRELACWKKLRAEIIRTSQQGTLRSHRNTSGADSVTNGQQGTLQSSSTISVADGKPLIIHGLLILAKLAVNPDNCKQIYDSKGLFSKIISPVKNKVYEIPSHDDITMEITEKALEVVSLLASGTDEINEKIRRDICSNGIAVNDIRPILERDHEYNKIKIPAIKILTELYLDKSTRATTGLDDIAEFIKVLKNIFFDAANESGLRKTTGKALAVLAMDKANCMMIMNSSTGQTSVQLLTAMIFLANGRLYQTSIAQLLMQFCANSDSNAKAEILKSVKPILHEVLKVICNIEEAANGNQAGSPQHNLVQQQAANTNQAATPRPNPGQQQAANMNQTGSPQHNPGQQQTANANQTSSPQHNLGQIQAANANQPVGDRRNSLAAFLGLALQICDKLEITADDFDTALARISLSMGEFVDKLNYIIEQCKGHSGDSLEGNGSSVEYLTVIKTVTKLCTWMMQSKPECITEFQNKNTSTKLQSALEDMRDLELGMLLTGGAGDMATYETLSTIVAVARQEMDAKAQV